MSDDFPSLDRHAQGWRLVSRNAHTGQAWINASDADPAMLLVLDTRGDWWAIAPDCRHCGAPLLDVLRKDTAHGARDELHCAQCGTAHGPHVADCERIALMVVDEEIYAAPSIDVRNWSE